METRTYFFIAVFVGSSAFVFLAVATPVADTGAPTAEEEKVLLDCQHSDYRTYIACLKRQKRHHADHGHHNQWDADDENCLKTCLKKCEVENTMHDCHKNCSHCIKRTKHKHQIITEYETECISGVCNNTSVSKDQQPVNIATTINVHNHLDNITNTCNCPTKQPCPCPPIQPPPPMILTPRVTIDFNTAQLGGCLYQGQWPCYPYPTGWNNIDCSLCANPLTLYRCHVSCYQDTNVTSQNPCISPNCVGGSLVH